MKTKGFTLIELLAVIVVLAIILAVAVPSIAGIIKKSTESAFESDAKMVLKAVEYRKLENESFDPLTITKANMQEKIGISSDNYEQVKFTIVDGKVNALLVGTGKWNGLTAYGGEKTLHIVSSDEYDTTPPVITVTGDNPAHIEIGRTYVDAGATAIDETDGDISLDIIKTGTVDTETLGNYTISYSVTDNNGNTSTVDRTVIVEFVSNAPVLATGMTPIKWNGSAWVTTTASDDDWYDYNSSVKKWANVQTADGSMWVWIPRYIYKISTGWHTNTVGTIDVLFSIGIDDTRGATTTIDTGTSSNASNNKWTNHPAFTFGTTEVSGIWVAKFEASGTTAAIDIKPNVVALRSTSVGNIFTATRNMETNSRYGWGTSGNGIDTHLIKNVEWGAAIYLAQSIYGFNAKIWMNPANTYTTGCAGASASVVSTVGCSYTYNTSNGQKASTTGNIYGIYDMNGASWEYVAAYTNNSSADDYGLSLYNADVKYKDVYPVTTDNQTTNYSNAINKKGDAVYETSNGATGSTSWYTTYTVSPYTTQPWFRRGGGYGDGTASGVYSFYGHTGAAYAELGFRPTILVGAGL